MVNSKRLLDMARKWKSIAALGRKKISSNTSNSNAEADACSSTAVADKGHFIVYTCEGRRFMVPLAFLRSSIFEELLRMSEEEFGLPGDGPITLPCHAAFFEFVLSMLRKRAHRGMEKELLMSIYMRHCKNSSFEDVGHCQQLSVF